MHIAAKIAIGAGIVGVGALALAACGGPKEQDAESKLLGDFQKFDRSPRDNNWTQGEATLFEVGRPYSTNRHNTYRVPDLFSNGYHQFYEQQIVHKETNSSMERLFAAAKGNDAVASLAELKTVAMRFDKDGNGTLNKDERKDFDRQFGAQVSSRTILDRVETGSYFVRESYPDNGGGSGTSPGDDYGGGYNPGNGGGSTSPGDDGGGYIPPSNGGGNGGGTSPGDGGGYTPPPSNGGGSGSGNSTDNGNPSEDDF